MSDPTEVLIVVSKVRKLVQDSGLRVGADFLAGLSTLILSKTQEACQKVKTEGKRKTLGKEDL